MSSAAGPQAQRAAWIALLARAPLDLLEAGLADHQTLAVHWLRRPETGLMMVQARAGGNGARFNLGEVTVTRATLRLAERSAATAVGVSYVLGRSHRHAELAALADALLQLPEQRAAVQRRVLVPVGAWLEQEVRARAARTASTRVDFFTVARQAGQGDVDERDEPN